MSRYEFKTNWVDELLEKGLDISQIAEATGKPRQSIVQWRSGTRPRVDAMIAVINALGIDPGFFFVENNANE